MHTSVAKIWIKFELCLCTGPRGAWNKFYELFPASCVCNGPPKSCYWACQSATMAMRGCSWAEVVFLTCAALTRQHAACASESDSITLAGPVSPRTLNAACLRVKVESITILTESPALNWPCAVFASRRYNAIRCHGRGWRLWQLLCGGEGSGRGRRTPCGRCTHAAQHWLQWQASAVACGWQSTNKSRLSRPADHGWISIRKFRIVASVSNRIE